MCGSVPVKAGVLGCAQFSQHSYLLINLFTHLFIYLLQEPDSVVGIAW